MQSIIREANRPGLDEKKILLVEDEKAIRDAVAAYLEREGYIVRGVGDGQSAVEEFEKHSFDLVILDLMLPKLSGERVCRAIRETSNVPSIMLTAKGEVEDRIIGLELGADDYLIKPFSPRELVARVRALLRRAHTEAEPALEVLDFGDLVIDISGHKVIVEGTEVDLTASEFKLLTTLATTGPRHRMGWWSEVLGYDFRATSARSARQEPARRAAATTRSRAGSARRRGISLRGSRSPLICEVRTAEEVRLGGKFVTGGNARADGAPRALVSCRGDTIQRTEVPARLTRQGMTLAGCPDGNQ